MPSQPKRRVPVPLPRAPRTFLASVVAVILGSPLAAPAQTFEEAVQANVTLALQLCLTGGSDMAGWSQSFRDAGFAERVERSTENSDTTHYFTAPAETARAELYYGEMPEHCTVSTAHMGVTQAAEVLDGVVPHLFPGYVRHVAEGPADPATGRSASCVRYEDPANPIGHVVGVAPGGDAAECVETGTSQFYSSYRV